MKKQAIKTTSFINQFPNAQTLSKNQMNLVKGGGDGDGDGDDDYIGTIDIIIV